MAQLKTAQNDQDVMQFINTVENEQKKTDSLRIMHIMKEITGKEPKMWGSSIVGYGSYHYEYKSGREGEWFLTGFSPRKQSLTIYVMGGLSHHAERLKNLGKYKQSKGCLYIKKLSDVDEDALRDVLIKSVHIIQEAHPPKG